MEKKLKTLCDTITAETQTELKKSNLACEANLKNAIAHYEIKHKYAYVDVGPSGKYMVLLTTGDIYGIKAYGQIHRGHYYGNLDTINNYYWGDYTAYKLTPQKQEER